MKTILKLILPLIIVSCQAQESIVKEISWFPIKVHDKKGFGESSTIHNHIVRFHHTDSMTLRTIGTSYFKTIHAPLSMDTSNYKNKDSIQSLQVISSTKDKLSLRFSPEIIADFIPYPDLGQKNEEYTLKKLLANRSWLLNDSLLLEFSDTLKKSIIQPQFHDQFLNVSIHNLSPSVLNSETAIYGTDYHQATNHLRIEGIGASSTRFTLFLRDFSDNLIHLYSYNEDGSEKEHTMKIVKTDHSYLTELYGSWQLSAMHEIKSFYTSVSGNFYERKDLTEEDFKQNRVIITFLTDNTFRISNLQETIYQGTLQPTQSGKLLEMIYQFKDQEDTPTETYYLLLDKITSSKLIFTKAEQIPTAPMEYESRIFKETYIKLK